MDRRQLLIGGLTATAVTPLTAPAMAAPASAPDLLNPNGVKVAGIKMLPVRKGRYKVWTKTIGDGPIKVLLLHGGPAACHDYLEAFESFLPPAGIQIIYYDQLGCGNSDIPDDGTLWTLPGFVEEVEEVRQGLGLDQFIMLGHSWGGVLGIDYALKYQRHLRGLVISNMAAGTQSYLKRLAALKLILLTPADRARLEKLEADSDYDNPAYRQIMMSKLYPQMLCRIQPWPEPLTRSFSKLNQKIYGQIQGPSEFQVSGNLKDWDRWDRLSEITVPSLTIGAMYDEMDPADIARMAQLMPNARNFTCPEGSHMSMWDDQAIYFSKLVAWLRTL